MNTVKKRVWEGAINIRIVFRESEYLLQIHRNSYFPLYYASIAQFFSNVAGVDLTSTQVWLEYEDVPLKWNMPAGLLYDLLFLSSHPSDQSSWTLTLRFEAGSTHYPKDHIIPFSHQGSSFDYASLLSQVVINHIKQACYVISGNSRAFMSLSEHDTKALWSSIVGHDYGVYSSVVKKFLPSQPKRVPIKLYVAGSATLIQAPVFPTNENGEPTTLRAVLLQWVPEMIANGARAFVQGIDVDVLYDQSISDVWYTFQHLDHFLYIVVVAS